MSSQFLFMQSEKVRQLLPAWHTQRWNVALDLIEKGEVETIGERDYRIPFQTQVGGRIGTYNPDMGDMGRGTAMAGGVMIASYFSLRMNFELSRLAMKATADKSRSVKNPFREAMKAAPGEFALYMDKFAHSDGTAVLATATAHTTSGGKSIYTLDNIFGVRRLRRGMYVTVYNNGLTTALSSATLYIETVDYNTRKIKLSGTVAGAGADDKICFEGVSGASPSGLKGIYYYNSEAATGTTLQVNRANEPEIIANYVNANGGLTHEHGMLYYHKLLERRGEVASSTVGLCPPAQQAQIYSNVMSIQNYNIADARSRELIDRLPALKGKKMFNFADMPHYIDIHQRQDRIDYLVPKTWGRAQLASLDFFEVDGQRFFPLYGASGAPAAGLWFGLCQDVDIYCVDPGSNGMIYGATIPTLYA